MGSNSLTTYWTLAPALGEWSLSHWTTREVPPVWYLLKGQVGRSPHRREYSPWQSSQYFPTPDMQLTVLNRPLPSQHEEWAYLGAISGILGPGSLLSGGENKMLYHCAVPQTPGVTNQIAVFLASFIFFFFFWPHSTWGLCSPARVEPATPALEVGVLTPGPPGESYGQLLEYSFGVSSPEGESINFVICWHISLRKAEEHPPEYHTGLIWLGTGSS